MRRVMVLALVGVACRASTSGDAPRTIPIGRDLAVVEAPIIVELPQEARYRFVAPATLVRGLKRHDEGSVVSPYIAQLREEVSTVFQSRNWQEVVDSADFEVTVFMLERSAQDIEVSKVPVESRRRGLPQCDISRSRKTQPECTTIPEPTRNVATIIPYTQYVIYHVIRRRADGAVKWWSSEPVGPTGTSPAVARDLLRMLLATDGA